MHDLTKSLKFIGVAALIILGQMVWSYAANAQSACLAPQKYLTELAQYTSVTHADQDYTCLVDLPSIQNKLAQYQLVDIRPGREQQPVQAGTWALPLQQLLHTHSLAGKNLLLLGDAFSRVKAAKACFSLKKQGFLNTKILLGGFDGWAAYAHITSPAQPITALTSITANDLMYEYFNGKVLLAVSNPKAADQLKALGFTQYILLSPQNPAHQLSQLMVQQSQQGFIPLVYMGKALSDIQNLSGYSNLYQLEGGLAALKKQSKNNRLAELSRLAVLDGAACDKAKL